MIYENIVRLCGEKKISIARLEKECGLGNATVRGWEFSDPRISKLKAVADYLGVTVESLMDSDAQDNPTKTDVR